ncbi:MAG: diphthine synthase [Desulfurococcaceae archaeon]
MLVFLGLGYSLRHLSKEAIEELERSDVVYIDTYTSLFEDPLEKISELCPRARVVYATRRDLEGEGILKIINEALVRKVTIAVPGDPFIATTHDAILSEALRRDIKVKIVNGISIITMAYSRTGLQSYRFGKIVTLVYPYSFKPYSTVDVIYDNLSRNLHTLILLDLRVEEGKAMTIHEAVDIILDLDAKGMLKNNLALALARLGWLDEKICMDKLGNLGKYSYPPPPHSIIVLAKLDPVEDEIVSYWRKTC